MTDQEERVDLVYIDFSKANESVFYHLLIKQMEAMGIHPMYEFLKNRTTTI